MYGATHVAMSCETSHVRSLFCLLHLPCREVANRERDSFPARRIPIRSPRHREFAELSVATPRSLYQSTICASQTRPIEIKEDRWYAAQHHIPILPPPARIEHKDHFGTVDEPAFPKDPMEVNKQQIRVLRDQV